MITINNYIKAESLEDAYELNQKRTNRILGGMMWIRLGKGRVQTAIDLSGLGLDKIEEDENEFRIGCMCPLREMELHPGLNACTQGAVRESLRHIVGTQFRNQATVGGSVFGRFGFSDVLTCLLALDSYVELYKGGIVPMREFVGRKRDRDILVRVIIKKTPYAVCYLSERATATDFPLIACCVAKWAGTWKVSVGARPMKAELIEAEAKEGIDAQKFAADVTESIAFGTNMRGTAAYRKQIAQVLIRRAVTKLTEEC